MTPSVNNEMARAARKNPVGKLRLLTSGYRAAAKPVAVPRPNVQRLCCQICNTGAGVAGTTLAVDPLTTIVPITAGQASSVNMQYGRRSPSSPD